MSDPFKKLREQIGTFRRFGPIGPVYEIIGVTRQAEREPLIRIRVVESGEELDYRLTNVLADPREV